MKECPFCGGVRLTTVDDESFLECFVQCETCLARGPTVVPGKHDPKPSAVQLWDERARSEGTSKDEPA